ncbi:MAG: GGDEF domain-containing protein [Magnetovibrionaceae bacterium]
MRMQRKIFYSYLLIFTVVFLSATWLYFSHFSQTLYDSEIQQISQINRYIEQDIGKLQALHRSLVAVLGSDGDVASAYDQVNWVSFMGRKFVQQAMEETFQRHPYLRELNMLKDGKPYIHGVSAISSPSPPGSLVAETAYLNVDTGSLEFKTDLIAMIRDHLANNRVDPKTRILFQTQKGGWVVSRDRIEATDLWPTGGVPRRIQFEGEDYLVSEPASSTNWEIRSLKPQTAIKTARQQLLYKTLIAYAVSAMMIFVIARFLSSHLINPVHRLEQAALSFMGGNYDPIEINREDEITPAIVAFNTMGLRIQNFTEDLRNVVSERTRELEIANKELERINETDGLTKAKNRNFLNRQIPHLVKLANRNKVSMGLALLDIDHFKSINDQHGHVIGDQCLVAFVEKLHQVFRRDNDWVVRYGGEEFCLICFSIDAPEFARQIEAFRSEIEAMEVPIGEAQHLRFTVSGGYHFFEIAPDQWSAPLIHQTDELLYEAKQMGRNRIVGAKG